MDVFIERFLHFARILLRGGTRLSSGAPTHYGAPSLTAMFACYRILVAGDCRHSRPGPVDGALPTGRGVDHVCTNMMTSFKST
jgi:hypothetical protein